MLTSAKQAFPKSGKVDQGAERGQNKDLKLLISESSQKWPKVVQSANSTKWEVEHIGYSDVGSVRVNH